MRKSLRLFLSLFLVFTPMLAGTAGAASNSITSNGNGYRISPVRTDLIVNRGQSASVKIYLTNISADNESLQVVIDDFQARDETGTPALLLDGQSLPKYGLKKYTTVPSSDISVKPGEQKTVVATVSIPSDATPGGYFGAVRFAPVGIAGQKTVNLAASVGSLILVKVPGDIHENVSITDFGVGKGTSTQSVFLGNKGLQAIIRFRNNGDVQEQPFGKILLKKGKTTLASYEINNTDQRGNVLPGSIRLFTTKLDKVGSFGKFTIEGNFGYGSNGQLLSATSTFYVVPLSLIAIAVILLLLIAAAVYTVPRAVRRHDRRILRRAKRADKG